MINDPMSQMAQAQKLSIPQLQQALRDGTINPQVGQIVLASKIKQDKEGKAAMAAQAPKQPPVIQQNLAYGAGVDALPSNLPPAGMAQGGIIAFDEGGDVGQRWNEYNAALQDATTNNLILPEENSAYDRLVTGMTPREIAKERYNQAKAADIHRMRGALYNAPGPGFFEKTTPAQREAYKQRENIVSNYIAGKYDPTGKAVAKAAPVAATPVDTTQVGKDYVSNLFNFDNMAANAVETNKKPAAEADKLSALDAYFGKADTGSASASTKTKGAGTPGIGGYEIKKYDDKELKAIYESELNPVTKQPYTYEEIADRDRKQAEKAGIDFDVYKSQREDLDKLKAKSAERSKLDSAMPWFAAAEAFGRQPRTGEAPQSTVGAITSALGAYGKSATDIDEKEQARQDKIRTEGNALALAQNAFNQAQYSGNKADLREAQSAVRSARTNLANLNVKGVDQQNEVAKEVFKANVELTKTGIEQAGANARYGKDEQTIKGIAKAILADHPEMSVSDALKQAYLTKGAASVYGTDVGADKSRLAEYNKYALGFSKNLANYGKQPLSYDQWLSGLGGPTATSAAVPSDISDIMGKYSG